ncbi:type IV pilin protein [Candidatus Omnitrophota bacterium]
MSRRKGFTLTELLVTIILIAILAAIAIPIYKAHVTRSKVTEVKAALNTVRTQMRLVYAEHRTYNPSTISPGPAIDLPGFDWGDLDGTYVKDGDTEYTIGDLDTYTFTCTFTGGGTSDSDLVGETLTIDQDGVWGGSLR